MNTKQTVELDVDNLKVGSNTLRFLLDEGDFTFNEVKVETRSKQIQNPTYIFSLSKPQFNAIQVGNKTLELQLFLEETKAKKRARILLNEREIFLDTTQSSYKLNIRDYIGEGANFLKIIPSNAFEIIGLKVVLDK